MNLVNCPPVRINESEDASPMAHASLHFNTQYLYNLVIQHYLVCGRVKGKMLPLTNSAVVSGIFLEYPPIRTTPFDETQLVCSYLLSVRSAYFGQTVTIEFNEAGENS